MARDSHGMERGVEVMSLDPFGGVARRALEKLEVTVGGLGLKVHVLPECPFGVGFGVAWSETRFSVVSVNFEESVYQANVVAGVLKDVPQLREPILDACNSMTRDHPLFATYLHDAEAGWDILIGQRMPIDLLVAESQFFAQVLKHNPVQAEGAIQKLAEAGINSSSRHMWNAEDSGRLLIRSLA